MSGTRTRSSQNRRTFRARALAGLAAAAGAALLLGGCHTDMWEQPKVKPLTPSDFFANGAGSRPLPQNTVARGHLRAADAAYFTGIVGGTRVPPIELTTGMPVETSVGAFRGTYVDAFPFRITRADLDRGRERFNIYCSPCHGRLGYGNGMIAQRGLSLRRPPANYHTDRLRKMPVGHFVDVIANGYGIMYSYAERIPDPADRWRIAAWIRVLQLSQHATPADAPPGALPPAPAEPAAPPAPPAGTPPAAVPGSGTEGAVPANQAPLVTPPVSGTGRQGTVGPLGGSGQTTGGGR